MPELETITGEVLDTRILGGDFFGRATVRPGKGASVLVVGRLLGVQTGDTVEVLGCWSTHPKFGRQFKLSKIETRVPRDQSGVVAWMTARLPNLGLARARALVEELGAEGVWNVIEHEPDRLLTVKGITPERRDEVVKAYWEHRAERDRIVRWKGWGLTDGQIAHVLEAWGARAEERIKADPYELVTEVYGFGFARADAVAQRMGLPTDSPARIRAGLAHVMREAETEGHCWLYGGALVRIATQVLGLEARVVVGQLHAAVTAGRLVRIGASERVTTPELAGAEDRVARRVRALAETGAMPGKEQAA